MTEARTWTLSTPVSHEKAALPPAWAVRGLQFSSDGRVLVSPPWRMDTATNLWERFDPPSPPRLPRPSDGVPTGFVGRRALQLEDGRWLITRAYRPARRGVTQRDAPADRTAELLVIDEKGTPAGELWAARAEPPELLGASGRLLVAATDELVIYNAVSLNRVATVPIGTPRALCVHPTEDRIAVSESSRITVRAAPDWSDARFLQDHSHAVTALAFHPTEPLLASGDSDGELRIWDLTTETVAASLRLGGAIGELTFAPDGGIAAAIQAGTGRIVQLRAVETEAQSAAEAPEPVSAEAEDDLPFVPRRAVPWPMVAGVAVGLTLLAALVLALN